MPRRVVLGAAVALGVARAAGAQSLTLVTEKTIPVRIGDRRVELRIETSGAGGLRYVNLHEDEHTSVSAARQLLRSHPGTLITRHTPGESPPRRRIDFVFGGKSYAFDPNRIFTDGGLVKSLDEHGTRATPGAIAQVRVFRDAVLATLADRATEAVVALHNNKNRTYTLDEYAPGGSEWLKEKPRRYGPEPGEHRSDFFLVTSEALFDKLRAQKFSAVLQSLTPFDDGSLSVWFAQQGRPYVNVEAMQTANKAHLPRQLAMLEAVAALCTGGGC